MNMKSIWNAMCGRNQLNEEASFEKTAASLKQFLQDKEAYTFLCAGTMNENKLKVSMAKLVDVLISQGVEAGVGDGHRYSFYAGGNVLRDAKCIELASKVNAVILMEEAFESTFANIDEELNAFKELNAPVAGVVLIHH